MGAMTTVARKPESTESPRTTYQDVLDAPALRAAEIVDGTQSSMCAQRRGRGCKRPYLRDRISMSNMSTWPVMATSTGSA